MIDLHGTTRRAADLNQAPRWTGLDWLLLSAVTALAAALRFYGLGSVPPGFQFDEAYNALDAARVLQGQHPLFLPANAGREVLYTYLQAGLAALFGLRLYTLRLASALAGIAAITVAYWLLRRMLGRHSRRVALFTALALAISFWHIHFSHYALRVILMPVLFSGVFGSYWLGSQQRRLWPYVVSGLLAGASVWTHPTGRLLPLAWVVYTLYQIAASKVDPAPGNEAGSGRKSAAWRRIKQPLAGLLAASAAALVVFLPLGLEFYRHPDFFFSHADSVSIFADRVAHGSPLRALLQNTLAVLKMFSVQGDLVWMHNLAGRPVFDLLLSVTFWLGMVIWVWRLLRRNEPDRAALVTLMLWTLLMLTPSVFSDDAPNFSRTLPALPALFLAVGLGLDAIVDAGAWLAARARPGAERYGLALGGGLAAVVLLFSSVVSVYDYFVRFPQQVDVYYAYDVDKLDAWSYIQGLMPGHQVYLAQLWAQHATLDFLRQGTSVKSIETGDTVVLPPAGQGAAYVFPAEQASAAQRIAALWPGTSVVETFDRNSKPLLASVILPAGAQAAWPQAASPAQPAEVAFVGGPTLKGMSQRGDVITLFWQAEGPMPNSLTSMLHLVDAHGNTVGLADKLPGNGSYPTTSWSAGERVIENYRPVVDPCVGDQSVHVVVGWYNASGGATPLPVADRTGNTAVAGEVRLPLSSQPADQVQAPHVLKQALPGGLTLWGYGATDGMLQAGSPLSLDLYWQGQGTDGGQPLDVQLASASQPGPAAPASLWQGTLAPAGAQWQPGEVLCRRLPLRLPPDAAAGQYQLQAVVGGQPVAIGGLALGASTRRFDAPAVAVPISATLGEQIRLLGYDLAAPRQAGEAFTVTLTWQAITPPQSSYKVFVHLVDESGAIVAQSDSLPAGNYATDGWLEGEVVLDVHQLTLPASAVTAGHRYHLVAGMYNPVTGQRPAGKDAAGHALADNAIALGEFSPSF